MLCGRILKYPPPKWPLPLCSLLPFECEWKLWIWWDVTAVIMYRMSNHWSDTWQKDYLVGVTYSNHVRSFKSTVFSAAGSRNEKSERFKALEGFYAPCWLEDGGATWQGVRAASRSWEQISSWQPARKWGPQSCNHKEVKSANNLNKPRSRLSPWSLPQSLQIRAQPGQYLDFNKERIFLRCPIYRTVDNKWWEFFNCGKVHIT